MAVSIILTFNAKTYDVSEYVIRNSVSIDEYLFSVDSLKPNTNKASFDLSRRCPYIDEIASYDDDIKVAIANDGAPRFTGYLTDDYNLKINNRGLGDVSFDCEDPGIKLLKANWKSTNEICTIFSGTKICDPGDTANSFIHVLAGLAGCSVSGTVPTISTQIYFSIQDTDKKQYWTIIEKVLYENRYVFYFDATGSLCLFSLDALQGPPALTISTDGQILQKEKNGSGIETKKRLHAYDDVTVKFKESTKESGICIFNDGTGASDTQYCNIEIAAGGYYPSTCDAETYAFIDYFLEDGRDILNVRSITADFSCDPNVTYELANLGKSARIRFYNNSSLPRYIRKLKITGQNVEIVNAESKVTSTESGKKPLEVEAEYLHGKTEAASLANLLRYVYKNCQATYMFNAAPAAASLGTVIGLKDPMWSGLNVTAAIYKRKYTLGRAGAEYKAMGVGSINLDASTKYAPTPTATKSSSVAIIYQYSVDGQSDWHSVWAEGDLFVRQSADLGATWGSATRLAGAIANTSHVFYDTPTAPYKKGDLWISDGVLYQSTVDRTDTFTLADWTWCIRSNISVFIESTNGDVFRPGQSTTTTLTPRAFKNGLEITDTLPDSAFRWTRTSFYAPNDDATWNSNHATGYRTVEVSTDTINARATYTLEILE